MLGLDVYVLNTPEFGHMLHPKRYGSLQEAADAYTDYKLKILGEHYLEARESYTCCAWHPPSLPSTCASKRQHPSTF